MKSKLVQFFLVAQKIDRRHIQLIVALIVLVMLVLGAGAPDDGGIGLR